MTANAELLSPLPRQASEREKEVILRQCDTGDVDINVSTGTGILRPIFILIEQYVTGTIVNNSVTPVTLPIIPVFYSFSGCCSCSVFFFSFNFSFY